MTDLGLVAFSFKGDFSRRMKVVVRGVHRWRDLVFSKEMITRRVASGAVVLATVWGFRSTGSNNKPDLSWGVRRAS